MLKKVLFIFCISLAVIESRHINKIKHGKRTGTETADKSADEHHGEPTPHGNFTFNSDTAKESISMSYSTRLHNAKKKSVEPKKVVEDLVQNGTAPDFKVDPNSVEDVGEQDPLKEQIKRNLTALKAQGKDIHSVLAIVPRQTYDYSETTTPAMDQEQDGSQEPDAQQSPQIQEAQETQAPQQAQVLQPTVGQEIQQTEQNDAEAGAESQPTEAPVGETAAGSAAIGSGFPYPTPSPGSPPESSVQAGGHVFAAKVIENPPSEETNEATTETPSNEEQQSNAPGAPTEAQSNLAETTSQAPVDTQTTVAAVETTIVMKTPTNCPEEIESLGCYADPDPSNRVFPNQVMTRDPADSLEKFLCSCASAVQSQGIFTFSLQDGVCYSGENEGIYDSKGESQQCINDSGLPCGDDDVYCQGQSGANSVYSVLTLQHPNVVKQ